MADIKQCTNSEPHAPHQWVEEAVVMDRVPPEEPNAIVQTHTEPIFHHCFGLTDRGEYPIIVVATSRTAGERYASTLRLENVKIVTSSLSAQGLRCRGIIYTPGYVEDLLSALDKFNYMHTVVTRNELTSVRRPERG